MTLANKPLRELHYQNFDTFSGSILYCTLENEFNNGYALESGRVTKNLTIATSDMQNEVRDLKTVIGNKAMDKVMNAPAGDACTVLTFDVFEEQCSTITPGELNPVNTDGNLKSRLLASNSTTTCSWVNIGSFDVLACAGGGGGGGGYIPPHGTSPSGTPIFLAENKPDVINKINKICVKNAVSNVLATNNGLKSTMAEILNNFVVSKSLITIDVIGGSTPNGAAGSVNSQSYNPNNKNYKATIQLDTDHRFENSSQEYVASVLIHEIGHAYIGYMNALGNNLVKGNLVNNNHEFMSKNYIKPITTFLKQTYGITDAQATALAWSGVTNSSSYTNSSSFSYGLLGLTMSKGEMEGIISDFITGKSGSSICRIIEEL